MTTRPFGITILAILLAVNTAFYVVLAALALFSSHALQSMLHTLSPSGIGPENMHMAMGRLLPLYYLLMAGATVALAIGFWKLWNGARIVVLALMALSLVGAAAQMRLLLAAPTTTAIVLIVLRLGLIFLLGWYLLRGSVREAFRRRGGATAAV
jgi:hypothetical protein